MSQASGGALSTGTGSQSRGFVRGDQALAGFRNRPMRRAETRDTPLAAPVREPEALMSGARTG